MHCCMLMLYLTAFQREHTDFNKTCTPILRNGEAQHLVPSISEVEIIFFLFSGRKPRDKPSAVKVLLKELSIIRVDTECELTFPLT
jgi:hypothetical protein